MFGHRREVTIGMKQAVTMFDAVCADDYIDSRSYGDATAAQHPVVRRCLYGKRGRYHGSCRELRQLPRNEFRLMITCPLQHLKQNDIANKNQASGNKGSKFFDLIEIVVSEKRNPNGRVC